MRILAFILLITIFPATAVAQNPRKFVREGNREYNKGMYDQSEIEYRRAIDAKSDNAKAVFNLGDALYRKEKYEEAGKEFSRHKEMSEGEESLAAADYNRGNALLKAGKIEESIEAYKSSLIANPGNHEAKYNLAYAQDLLQQQQQQQQQQKDNQDNQQQDDKKDQNNNDQEQEQDQDKQKQDQDQDQKDNQQQQNQDQQEDNQQKNQDASQPKMTREDAERLLQALANEEKEVQEKVKKEKAAAARVRVLKNW